MWNVRYFSVRPQVALRSSPDTLAIQNDGDEMLLQATAAHLKVGALTAWDFAVRAVD